MGPSYEARVAHTTMRLTALNTLEVEVRLAYVCGDEHHNIYVVIRPVKNALEN